MPCTYYLPGEEAAITRRELDRATRLLCEAAQKLGEAGLPMSRELTQWWAEHQKRDAERIENERINARRAQDRAERELAEAKLRVAKLEAKMAGRNTSRKVGRRKVGA